MKKMFVVMIVVAMAIGACGKKAAPATPKAGSDMGSAAAPATDGSAAPAGGETPAPSM